MQETLVDYERFVKAMKMRNLADSREIEQLTQAVLASETAMMQITINEHEAKEEKLVREKQDLESKMEELNKQNEIK